MTPDSCHPRGRVISRTRRALALCPSWALFTVSLPLLERKKKGFLLGTLRLRTGGCQVVGDLPVGPHSSVSPCFLPDPLRWRSCPQPSSPCGSRSCLLRRGPTAPSPQPAGPSHLRFPLQRRRLVPVTYIQIRPSSETQVGRGLQHPNLRKHDSTSDSPA